MLSDNKLAKFFDMHLDRKPQRITERLTYLGEIPRKTDFENSQAFGKKEGEKDDDYIIEDTALVYKSSEGYRMFSFGDL